MIVKSISLLLLFVLTVATISSTQAETEKPVTVDQLKEQAGLAISEERSAEAVKLLTEILKHEPKNSAIWYRRACENFRIGQFKQSVADFDQFVELNPAAEQKLWERGISHYYAGMHKQGAEQFALYQTYHDNDVENSVWRYICMVKTDGVEKARKEMLTIKNDPRIPLMTSYAMFQGKATAEDVLADAKAGNPEPEVLAGRMFYAQLYLGLYYEAHSKPELAKKYITQAWKDHEKTQGISRYMWNVARVHAEFLKQKAEK
ncbi:MAG: hypothetical protein JKY95_00710 [Planctomycetaceae bacterium]|nr:hypothetical protein [Planctomycetaceae bacterium]